MSNRISSLLVLHPVPCFLGRFIWSKSPLSLLGLIFRLCKYNCDHPIQHHFLSITILSNESFFRVCPIHFLFLFLLCARVKVLSSPILSITSLFALCSI